MPFRFSLKWMLLAMVYAAVAAAAFSQRAWFYNDVLWAVLMAAFGYALLVVAYARGERQARAAGFAVLAACFLACLYLVPDSMPTRNLVYAIAAPFDEVAQVQYAYASPAVAPMPASPVGPPGAPSYTPYAPPVATAPMMAAPITIGYSGSGVSGYYFKLRAANAVATLGAGLIGCVLGAAAYRASRFSASEG
jgi:hypothetical protein